MKKVILSTLFVLFSSVVFSQKCEFERNKIDEFTGTYILETYVANLKPVKQLSLKTVPYLIYLGFAKYNDIVCLRVVLSSRKPFIIHEDDLFYIKFSNDSIAKFKTSGLNMDAKPTHNQLTGITAFGMTNLYPVSIEDIEEIAKRKVVKVRMETSDGYYESDVVDKGDKTLKEIANCFLKEVDKTSEKKESNNVKSNVER